MFENYVKCRSCNHSIENADRTVPDKVLRVQIACEHPAVNCREGFRTDDGEVAVCSIFKFIQSGLFFGSPA